MLMMDVVIYDSGLCMRKCWLLTLLTWVELPEETVVSVQKTLLQKAWFGGNQPWFSVVPQATLEWVKTTPLRTFEVIMNF